MHIFCATNHRAHAIDIVTICICALVVLATPLVAASSVVIYPVNPEHVVIGTIFGVRPDAVAILDGFSFVRYSNASNYDVPALLTPGYHAIRAYFNGIYVGKTVLLADNENRSLFLVFPRTETFLSNWIDQHKFSLNQALEKSIQLTSVGQPMSSDWEQIYDGPGVGGFSEPQASLE